MTIYTETSPDLATHTLELFRGVQPIAEGEDYGLFFAGDIQPADALLTWLEGKGCVPEDPDVYALVMPAGEGRDNRALAVLPIAPACPPTPELAVEQTAARNLGGRPSVAEDGYTTRVTVTLPDQLVRRLDREAARLGITRAALMRIILADRWAGKHLVA